MEILPYPMMFFKPMENNYIAQLTMEGMRGEFISTVKGAYTHKMDYADCIYGVPGEIYTDMDFSKVMNFEKKPIISDLPPEKANDTIVRKILYCCRNGSLSRKRNTISRKLNKIRFKDGISKFLGPD